MPQLFAITCVRGKQRSILKSQVEESILITYVANYVGIKTLRIKGTRYVRYIIIKLGAR